MRKQRTVATTNCYHFFFCPGEATTAPQRDLLPLLFGSTSASHGARDRELFISESNTDKLIKCSYSPGLQQAWKKPQLDLTLSHDWYLCKIRTKISMWKPEKGLPYSVFSSLTTSHRFALIYGLLLEIQVPNKNNKFL